MFTRLKNTIQVNWYENKLDREFKRKEKKINKEINTMDKKIASAAKASDKRNVKWLKEQDKVKRQEYEEVWRNAPEKPKKPGLRERLKQWFKDVLEDSNE